MMFIDNRHAIEYFTLIEYAASETRHKTNENYFESHHIIPRSLGGSNNSDNLVLLTAYEHLKAHMLLPRMTNKGRRIKMLHAFGMMVNAISPEQQRVPLATLSDDDLRAIAKLREELNIVRGITCRVIDPTGAVIDGNSKAALVRKSGVPSVAMHCVINGEMESYKGWRGYHLDLVGIISDYTPPYKFINPQGGVVESETLVDLVREFKLDADDFSAVWSGTHDSHRGWRKYHDDLVGVLSDYDPLPYKFINPQGDVICGRTLTAISNKFTLLPGKLSKVWRGKVSQYRGWRKYHDDLVGVLSDYDPLPYKFINPQGALVCAPTINSLAVTYNLRATSLSDLWHGKRNMYCNWQKYTQ